MRPVNRIAYGIGCIGVHRVAGRRLVAPGKPPDLNRLPRAASVSDVLLGRERECERIDGALDLARSGKATACAIRGEAGVGKTSLLDYASARADGMRVVRVRAVESETELAFVALADVCRPLLDRLDALPTRQRAALRTALGLAPGDSTATDRLVLGAATLGLLETATEAESLLLIVDDADWLDGESAAVLLFAEEPRTGGCFHYSLGEALAEGAGEVAPLPAGVGIMMVCPICSARSFSM
jgi:hypothetical protein